MAVSLGHVSSLHSASHQRRPVRAKCVTARAVLATDRGGVPQQAPGNFPNQLEALKSMSLVVADTGDPAMVKKYRPVDSTTNPSLVYKAVQQPEYQRWLQQALQTKESDSADPSRPFAGVSDVLSVLIGKEILEVIPGRVSTEVDAHLSYDTEATYSKALRLIDLYTKQGVDPKRVYIKIASTWEGIRACERLQKQGIDCNMTLLFSFAQAAACADAGAALISPFVGRIMDWYKAKEGVQGYAPHEDPGVHSVQRIYKYYKAHGYGTIVMAASFRNVGEVREIAGCDNITISPQLLAELEASTEPLPRKLWPDMGGNTDKDLRGMDHALFKELHEADQMAVDKLAEGIEGFASDQRKLEAQLAALAANMS